MMRKAEYLKTWKINFNIAKILGPSVIIILIATSIYFDQGEQLNSDIHSSLYYLAMSVSFFCSLILSISSFRDVDAEVRQGTWSQLMTSKVSALDIVLSKIFCAHPTFWFWYVVSAFVLSTDSVSHFSVGQFYRILLAQFLLSTIMVFMGLWANRDWGRLLGRSENAFLKMILSIVAFLSINGLTSSYKFLGRIISDITRRRGIDWLSLSPASERVLFYIYPTLFALILFSACVRIIRAQKGESLFPLIATITVPFFTSLLVYLESLGLPSVEVSKNSWAYGVSIFYLIASGSLVLDVFFNFPRIINYRRFYRGLKDSGLSMINRVPQQVVLLGFYLVSLVGLIFILFINANNDSVIRGSGLFLLATSFLIFRDMTVFAIIRLLFQRTYMILFPCYLLFVWFVLGLITLIGGMKTARYLIFPPAIHINISKTLNPLIGILPYLEFVIVLILLGLVMYNKKVLGRVWQN